MTANRRRDPQLTAEQRVRALGLLEQMPWGDMDGGIRAFEAAPRRALEVTAEDFRRWDEYLGPDLEGRGFNEFDMPPGAVEAMSDEDKLAYLARLLRSLALSYGVSAGFGAGRGGLVGEAHEPSPAALLRGLNDILWLPTLSQDEGETLTVTTGTKAINTNA
jgi:hypothetical protein